MIESITFNYTTFKLIVSFSDGTYKEYTNSTDYLADFPNRLADVVAIGW